jgi:hypothetical protein
VVWLRRLIPSSSFARTRALRNNARTSSPPFAFETPRQSIGSIFLPEDMGRAKLAGKCRVSNAR